MQAAPADVTDAQKGLPRHLPLQRNIPAPGFRVLKSQTLSGHDERDTRGTTVRPSAGRARSFRIIHAAQRDAGIRLEGRIAAEEDGIAHAQAGDKAACAGAQHGLVVEAVSNAEAWLNIPPLDVRIMVGKAFVKEVVDAQNVCRNSTVGGRRKAVAGNDHAVVKLINCRSPGN